MGNNKDGFGSEEPPGIRRAYMSELEIISKSRLSERLTCRPTLREVLLAGRVQNWADRSGLLWSSSSSSIGVTALLPSVLPRPLQATHTYLGFPISRQERREERRE